MCPYCQQNAPIIYRGIVAYCTACGRERPVLSGSSVTMAGKTERVGGKVVRTLGYVALAIGMTFAVLLALVVSLFTTAGAALTTGAVIGILTLAISLPLLFGGKTLEKSGGEELNKKQVQALFALAANRGGILRPENAATSLDITLAAADALLTQLAKTRYEEVQVDVTEQGEVIYKFPRLLTVTSNAASGGWGNTSDAAKASRPRVAVDAAPPLRPAAEPIPPQQVIDAEFEDIQSDLAQRKA